MLTRVSPCNPIQKTRVILGWVPKLPLKKDNFKADLYFPTGCFSPTKQSQNRLPILSAFVIVFVIQVFVS